jgi:hypothetical protein
VIDRVKEVMMIIVVEFSSSISSIYIFVVIVFSLVTVEKKRHKVSVLGESTHI